MYSFTVKSKVLQILTYIRQERLNERYRNTVNQKDEKPHTAGLDDTAIPHIKIKTTEIPLEKKLNTVNPYVHFIIATAAKNVKKTCRRISLEQRNYRGPHPSSETKFTCTCTGISSRCSRAVTVEKDLLRF